MDDLVTRYNYDSFTPEKFEPWMNFESSPKTGGARLIFPYGLSMKKKRI
jgi:hypothetical protein